MKPSAIAARAPGSLAPDHQKPRTKGAASEDEAEDCAKGVNYDAQYSFLVGGACGSETGACAEPGGEDSEGTKPSGQAASGDKEIVSFFHIATSEKTYEQCESEISYYPHEDNSLPRHRRCLRS